MAKKKDVFMNPAFQSSNSQRLSFNIAPEINHLKSFFQVKELDPLERNDIEKIILEHVDKRTESQTAADVECLAQMTAEIRAIGKQGLLLIGERVAKAQEILKSYRDGAFTKWLDKTFGARRTGYNILRYYELFRALPEERLRENFKKIPQKAAYILANREGDLELKAEIVREYYNLNNDELILLVNEKFPIEASDRRRGQSVNRRLIQSLVVAVRRIQKRKELLSQNDRRAIIALKEVIDSILACDPT